MLFSRKRPQDRFCKKISRISCIWKVEMVPNAAFTTIWMKNRGEQNWSRKQWRKKCWLFLTLKKSVLNLIPSSCRGETIYYFLSCTPFCPCSLWDERNFKEVKFNFSTMCAFSCALSLSTSFDFQVLFTFILVYTKLFIQEKSWFCARCLSSDYFLKNLFKMGSHYEICAGLELTL